ncbi:division inhibitor protein [Phycisphaerae bacterium RAS1]|nr:division inhibitor protein [Phycisphaerae bacterium RAS1]
MPRPSQIREKRSELTPLIARAFAELSYRRTTTAELARRCGVRENILYRMWPDKRAMFIAAIEHVYERSVEIWRGLLEKRDGASPAEQLLNYEAGHHGEFGLYRILFAGLSETDDAEISAALKRTYERFVRFLSQQVAAHRRRGSPRRHLDAELAAWAFVGLGTAVNIGRELELISRDSRTALLARVGRMVLDGETQ